jgi:hypothetical protein
LGPREGINTAVSGASEKTGRSSSLRDRFRSQGQGLGHHERMEDRTAKQEVRLGWKGHTGSWRRLVQTAPGIKVHPPTATSRLRKAAEDPVPGQHPDPSPPIGLSGEAEWEVEQIMALLQKKALQYRAKWTGYESTTRILSGVYNKGSPIAIITEFVEDVM